MAEHNRTSDADKFWPKVQKTDTCWNWTGCCDRRGYGRVRFNGRFDVASRVSWAMHNGPIPSGQCVLHRCDQPSCVNPAHLFLGTHGENAADRNQKGRQARGVRHHSAKLTNKHVIEIRHRLALGHKRRHVARDFAVSKQTIDRVVNRQTWRHVS